MKKLVKRIAILLPGRIFYQEREEFFHGIINKLQSCRNTSIPGFNPRINSPAIEAEFDLSIFVQTFLEKNEDTAQIAIICRGLRISVEDLCQYLGPSSGPKLLAKITAEAHP